LCLFTFQRNAIFSDPVTLWRSVAKSTPNKRRIHQNLATSLLSQGIERRDPGLYWEALRELQTVLFLPDDNGVDPRLVFGAIGMTYYHLDMVGDAVRAWTEGLERFPGDAALEGNIAFALVRQGRFDEALPHALTSRAADPSLYDVANTLGLIYFEKREYSRAAEQFLAYQELRPEEPLGYWNAALAYEKAGNYLQATEMATRFLAREQDAEKRNRALSFLEDMQTGGPKLTK
jgi:tetratricopeptide (TPR) repeat protein